VTTATITTERRQALYKQAFEKLEEALRNEEAAKAAGSPDAISTAERAVAEHRAEMERIRQEMEDAGDEEMVVLISPNREAPYTRDCFDLEFRHGRAVAPRSLAEHYLDVLEGYSVEQPS
jgi:hypothetical protein